MIGNGGCVIPVGKIENIIDEAKEVMSSGIKVESQFNDIREELI